MTSKISLLLCLVLLSVAVRAFPRRRTSSCDDGYEKCPTTDACINRRYFCDTDNDCGDNSDEDETLCSERTCSNDEFRCNNGQCISKELFCSGFHTCRDTTQPLDSFFDTYCPPLTCTGLLSDYKCPHRRKCIASAYLCDMDNDCGDGSDENQDFCANRQCPDDEIKCNNGQCLNKENFCNGQATCKDNSSPEVVCPPFTCQPDEFKCPNKRSCIPNRYLCDGDNDCRDNSDELLPQCASFTCQPDQFKCPNKRSCIPNRYLCDGDNDCGDNSDELLPQCASFTCQPGYFKCPNKRSCIPNRFLCDGDNDCGDNSDELQPQCGGHGSGEECLQKVALGCIQHLVPMQSLSPDITDLKEPCGLILGAYRCFLTTVNNECTQADRENIMNLLAGRITHGLNLTGVDIGAFMPPLEYLCEEHIDVFNEHLQCLKSMENIFPQQVAARCPTAFIGINPPCLSKELVTCATEVVTENCGAEIAHHLSVLYHDFTKPLGCQTDSNKYFKRGNVGYHKTLSKKMKISSWFH